MKLKLLIIAIAFSGCADVSNDNEIKSKISENILEKSELAQIEDGNPAVSPSAAEDVSRDVPRSSLYSPSGADSCDENITDLVQIGMAYDELRPQILTAGFVAYQDNDYHECRLHEDLSGWRLEWCKENPELEAYAPTGSGPRLMTWQKSDVFMRVYTNGEEPIVSEVECRRLN